MPAIKPDSPEADTTPGGVAIDFHRRFRMFEASFPESEAGEESQMTRSGRHHRDTGVMSGLRALAVRSALLPALAVYFFCFTNVIPALHNCLPFANGGPGGERLADWAPLPEDDGAAAPRERAGRTDDLFQEGVCVACLFSARLRGLSPPAGVTVPVLAQTQRLPRQAIRIPALADHWIQLFPRGPPARAAT
jgi:hypothetical protein